MILVIKTGYSEEGTGYRLQGTAISDRGAAFGKSQSCCARHPHPNTWDVGHPRSFLCEQAADIVFDEDAVFMASIVNEEPAEGSVVENIIGDDAVFEVLDDDAVGGTPEAFVAVVAAGLQRIAGAGDAGGSVEKNLR
jgi:hypothetical protein